jgi:hypothetical protein
MFKFTICELVLITAIAATGIGWWLDHRAAVYECNRQLNPLMEYASRLRIELNRAKVTMYTRHETLIRLLVDQGRSEDEMRMLLADDAVNWAILEEATPYSFH